MDIENGKVVFDVNFFSTWFPGMVNNKELVRFIVPNGLPLACEDSQGSQSVSQVWLKIHLIHINVCESHLIVVCVTGMKHVTTVEKQSQGIHINPKTELWFFSGTEKNQDKISFSYNSSHNLFVSLINYII